MIGFLDRLAKAVFQFIYSEPDESQIDSMLKRAFGLKSNITYSVSGNNITAIGDLSGNEKMYVDIAGNLHAVNLDSEFDIKNDYLYEVE